MFAGGANRTTREDCPKNDGQEKGPTRQCLDIFFCDAGRGLQIATTARTNGEGPRFEALRALRHGFQGPVSTHATRAHTQSRAGETDSRAKLSPFCPLFFRKKKRNASARVHTSWLCWSFLSPSSRQQNLHVKYTKVPTSKARMGTPM